MIILTLKHWIYDLCIDQLFKGISRNFLIIKRDIKIGDLFNRIKVKHYSGYIEMYNCKVEMVTFNMIYVLYDSSISNFAENDPENFTTYPFPVLHHFMVCDILEIE